MTLIEEARTNSQTHLSDFTAWSNARTTAQRLASNALDPGGNNAVKIIANTNNTLKLLSVNSVPTYILREQQLQLLCTLKTQEDDTLSFILMTAVVEPVAS